MGTLPIMRPVHVVKLQTHDVGPVEAARGLGSLDSARPPVGHDMLRPGKERSAEGRLLL